MNASQFYQYIQNPDRMGIHDEIQLRGLLKEYPYFQSGQILLAKCLKNMDNYLFEKQLKLAALYAPNRSMLYTLLKNTDNAKQQAATVPEPLAKAKENNTVEVDQSGEKEHQVLEEVINDPPENTYEVFTIEPLAEDPYQHHFRAEELTVAKEIEDGTTPEKEELRSFEEMRDSLKNILTAIEDRVAEAPEHLETTVVQTTSEQPAGTEPEFQQLENSVNEGAVEKPIELPKADTRDLQAAESLIEQGLEKHNEEMLAATEVRSFSEWLNLKSPSLEETKLLHKPTEEEILRIDFVAALETRVAEPSKPMLDMDAILENFMQHTPTISRPKAEFFNPIKSAKKSVEEDEDIATETLARIVLKQGNALKAIRIYEKLILKYPDKSTIFAGQIEKIKQDNQPN
ncbi:MAG: hypothetical protein EXR21_02865 [Flavobacteriaceae bacterium]|nr:hypothetical protein [Flavobacteriaceae bacterium]